MSKKTKIIIGIVLFLGVVAYLWFAYLQHYWKASKNAENSNIPKDGTSGLSNGNLTVQIFPLKQGSKNNEVLQLQKALNILLPLPYKKIAEDSVFGGQTEGALNTVMGSGYYPLSELQYKVILTKAHQNQSMYNL